MKIIPRFIKKKLLESLQVSPIVFLNGPRQAGKSTLVQGLSKTEFSGEYITFDNATQMAAAALAPIEFLTSRKEGLIIDEVQLVPEIFRALKIVVDDLRTQKKNKVNGQFLLTGSANILALPKLSDALVGRMNVLTLYPLSCSEAIGGKGKALKRILEQDFSQLTHNDLSLIEAIKLATFPEISGNDESSSSIWFEGYLSTILQRDVRMLADLEKIALLPTLLRLLSSRVGNLINDAEISRDIGLNAVTEKFYRKILQMMFLIFDVMPWYRNIGKRLVKSTKGYIFDTRLLCHLLGYSIDSFPLQFPNLFGHAIENFVACELMKLLSFEQIKAQLFHFRTSDGKEVDFIIEYPNGSIIAIEVKASEIVDGNDFKGLRDLENHIKEQLIVGIVLYSGKKAVPFGKKLWAVPYSILWQ